MSDKNTLGLSRRRLLGGLGAIGIASAGAGLGTSAYFSDTESFTGNMMTAGELDLAVDYVVHEDQGDAGTYTINSFTNTVNGTDPGEELTLDGDGTAMSQQLDDVKPGDHGHSYFCFTIDDNPAYMWMCGELTGTSENSYTEPEPEDDNGEGELEEAIEVEVKYCTLNDQGVHQSYDDTIFTGSLRELLVELQSGLMLDGSGDGTATPGNQTAFEGTGGDADSNPCICVDWWLPTTVGNEIQGDSLEFDLSFHAVQSRHTDGTENPCVDESYTAEYVNPDGIANPIPDGVLRLDVSYGDQLVVYDIQFDEPAGDPNLYDPGFASANFSMPFDADDDGIYDFQVAWNAEGGDSFQYSGVNSTPNWEKDTSAGWSALPAGFSASKSGPNATIVVPRSALDGGSDDSYLFGFLASAGGEQPSVSIPGDGPYSSNDNFTSSENGQSTTLQ